MAANRNIGQVELAAGSTVGGSAVGDLTTAAHGSLDHAAIPGAGLDLRRSLLLPQGFGYGQLLARPFADGAATPLAQANGVDAIGSLADCIGVRVNSPAAPSSHAGSVLGQAVEWNPTTTASTITVHSPATNRLALPIRLVAQAQLLSEGNGDGFIGVATAATSPVGPLPSGANYFGFGFGTGNWSIERDGGAGTDTGVSILAAAVILVMTQTVSGTWVAEILNATTLATVYGPTSFSGLGPGAHGFHMNVRSTGGGIAPRMVFWGATVGPVL